MRYALLIDGFPFYSRNPIKYNGRWIGNPPAEILLELGYKPVYMDYYPAEEPEPGYYWKLVWSEDEERINGAWVQTPEDE